MQRKNCNGIWITRCRSGAAIEKAAAERKAPFLIYQESNVIIRALRDYFRNDIGEILIDNPDVYKTAEDFVKQVMPNSQRKLKLYDDAVPLFNRYQIEGQIESAFQREVSLPSGGAIVIDHTEALISIDINSARATKGSDIEETATNTNLEAADEIARQLRLRDLGGLVVIDFIDMMANKNQRAVENRLREALKMDRARVQIGRISRFGLLEMSRQRLRPSLGESTQIVCPRCNGYGTIRNIESLSLSLLRIAEEESLKEHTGRVIIQVPVEVSTFIFNEKRKDLVEIEARTGVEVSFIANQSMETPHYDVTRVRVSEAREYEDKTSYGMAETDDEVYIPNRDSANEVEAEQPAVRSITPAQPAPTVEKKVEKAPGFLTRIIKALSGGEEAQETSKPSSRPNQRNDRNNNDKNSDARRGRGRGRGRRNDARGDKRNENQAKGRDNTQKDSGARDTSGRDAKAKDPKARDAKARDQKSRGQKPSDTRRRDTQSRQQKKPEAAKDGQSRNDTRTDNRQQNNRNDNRNQGNRQKPEAADTAADAKVNPAVSTSEQADAIGNQIATNDGANDSPERQEARGPRRGNRRGRGRRRGGNTRTDNRQNDAQQSDGQQPSTQATDQPAVDGNTNRSSAQSSGSDKSQGRSDSHQSQQSRTQVTDATTARKPDAGQAAEAGSAYESKPQAPREVSGQASSSSPRSSVNTQTGAQTGIPSGDSANAPSKTRDNTRTGSRASSDNNQDASKPKPTSEAKAQASRSESTHSSSTRSAAVKSAAPASSTANVNESKPASSTKPASDNKTAPKPWEFQGAGSGTKPAEAKPAPQRSAAASSAQGNSAQANPAPTSKEPAKVSNSADTGSKDKPAAKPSPKPWEFPS